MDWIMLLRGLGIGFAIAAPVGPIGLLCIQRTLTLGRLGGLLSGLGAATADALYGLIAATGLTLVAGFLVDQQQWLALVGGLFLCYLGIVTLRKPPAGEAAAAATATSLAGAYASTLILTLTNPMTILAFVAIFSGMGLATAVAGQGPMTGASLVLGVFLGSAGWWLLLSGAVGLVRGRLRNGWLLRVNQVAGLLILGFGLWALWTGWHV